MLDEKEEEHILNVFRWHYPGQETLTTGDLADELSVSERTAQKYVNELSEKNRLAIKFEGKPNRWRLADTEPTEPIQNTDIAKAKVRANKAAKVGKVSFTIGVGILAAAGLVMSNHVYAQAFDIYVPLLDSNTAATAAITGVVGTLLFLISFLALVYSNTLPWMVGWLSEGPLPDEQ